MENKNKYGAIKTEFDGIIFDSRMEAEYYQDIKIQEAQGVTELIAIQPKTYMTDAKVLYKPDFLIRRVDADEYVYIDVKGFRTASFNIKARLWKEYMGLDLYLVKKMGTRFVITEIIEGKNELRDRDRKKIEKEEEEKKKTSKKTGLQRKISKPQKDEG